MNRKKESRSRYPLSLRFLAVMLAVSVLFASSGFQVLAEKTGNEIQTEEGAETEKTTKTESTVESEVTTEEEKTEEPEKPAETEEVAEIEKTTETDKITETEKITESEEAAETEETAETEYTTENEKTTETEHITETEETIETESTTKAEETIETEYTAEIEKATEETEFTTETELSAETETEEETETEAESESESETETEQEKADVSTRVEQTLIRSNGSDRIQYVIKIKNNEAEKEAITDIKVLLPETVTFTDAGIVTVSDLQVFDKPDELSEGVTIEEAGAEVRAAYANGQAVMWLNQPLAAEEEREYFFSGTPSDATADKEAFKAVWLINGERLADDKISWAEDQDLRTEVQQSVELDNVVITVTYAPDVIPEDAQLVASAISEAAGTSPEVLQRYDDIMNAEAKKADATITDRLYFDISFQREDGQEAEPEKGPVSVRMEFKAPEAGEAVETEPELPFVILNKKGKEDKKAAREIAKAVAEERKEEAEASWILVHLENDTTPVDITADDSTNIVTDSDNAIQEVNFELASFSKVLAGSGQEEVDLGNTARALKTALEGNQYAGRIIQLTEDIMLPDNFGYINITKEITLDLNGYTIDGNDKQNDYIAVVNSGGKLTLESGLDGGKLTKGNKGAVKVAGTGEFTLKSGSITNNIGGQPAVLGTGSSKITIAGGSIDNNRNTREGNRNLGCGGGIRLEGGELTMTGGEVAGNHSVNWGGGIAVGKGYNGCNATFKMTGGTIRDNVTSTAQDSEGGGIAIMLGANATITDGIISGNATRTAVDWGGGGIFVSDGATLSMSQVLITGNHAGGFGGGLAGCSTGRLHVFKDAGGAIYGNTASGTTMSGGGSAKHEDHAYAYENATFTRDGAYYQDFFCAFTSVIYNEMLGGGYANWIGTMDGKPVEANGSDNEVLISSWVMGLTANPTARPGSARVEIRGNTSTTHGGGILCNGIMTIGTTDKIVIGTSLELEGLRKTLDGSSDLSGHEYKFDFLDEDNRIVLTARNNAEGKVVFNDKISFGEMNWKEEYGDSHDFVYYLKERVTTDTVDGKPVETDASLYKIVVRAERTTGTQNVGLDTLTKINYKITDVSAYKSSNGGKDGTWSAVGNTVFTAAADEAHSARFNFGSRIIFANTVNKESKTELTLKGIKILKDTTGTGRTTADYAFTFILAPMPDPETQPVPMPEKAEAVSNDKGEFSFGTITYDAEGIYRYTVREKKEAAAGISYDSTIYTVTVTVTGNQKGQLESKVTYSYTEDGEVMTDRELAEFTNTYTAGRVQVLKIDALDGRRLAGAHIQVLDAAGIVIDQWDSTTEVHVVEGLEVGVSYTLRETSAPNGYKRTADTTFTLNDNGEIDKAGTTAKVNDAGVLLVEDEATEIEISKIDATTGEPLAGAVLRIIDQDGNWIEEWTTDGGVHIVRAKLAVNTEYQLTEVSAPAGYELAAPIPFQVDGNGRADPVVMKNAMTVSQNARIRVEKELTINGYSMNAVDQTFYVALYADAACTKRISEIMPLVYRNASSSTVSFTGLELGRTYYIGECDGNGTVITAGVLNGAAYTANFAQGNSAVVTEADGTATVYFENQFATVPTGFYIAGELTVTKKLLGADGKAMNSDEVFYAGIFADRAFTTLSGQVSENIIELDLNGGSSASAAVEVILEDGVSQTLYVTEVDESGRPVAGSSGFEYEVSVDRTSVTVTRDNLDASVTITNRETEAEESEMEESETESETAKTAKAVKTGDNTPVALFVIILLAAALVIVLLGFRRRRRKDL